MTEINFQPVFEYIDTKFAENNTKIFSSVLKYIDESKGEILSAIRLEVASDLREIRTDIANVAGQVSDLSDEMRISNHRVTRLEEWALPVGKKLSLPLDL